MLCRLIIRWPLSALSFQVLWHVVMGPYSTEPEILDYDELVEFQEQSAAHEKGELLTLEPWLKMSFTISNKKDE